MKKSMMYLRGSIGVGLVFLFAVGLVGVFLTVEVSAQIRPAITKNVDEPGRLPYQVCAEFWASDSGGCASGSCSNFSKFYNTFMFDLPVVPAGKRLIIRYVSGRLGTTNTAVHVVFQDFQIVFPQVARWNYFGPFYSAAAGGMIGFSTDAFFTYDPGERPHVNLLLPGYNNSLSNITVSGYLIDATN